MAEADPRSSNYNTNYDFEKLQCDFCREAFSVEKPAKLLPCLHSACDECLTELIEADQTKSEEEKDPTKKDLPGEEIQDENLPGPDTDTAAAAFRAAPKSNDGDENLPGPDTDTAAAAFRAAPKSNDGASSTTAEENQPRKPCCSICKLEFSLDEVVTNPFFGISLIGKLDFDQQDGSPAEEKFSICMSCDENQRATSFCLECQEWLCDPCVVAHKRVRITKDHTIRTRMEHGEGEEIPDILPGKRQMFCSNHKTEPLKLFCLTCEALTCRDCQLNEHKDHKYQFIEETIDQQKQALLDKIKQLQEKISKNEELSEKMSKKEKDIKKQQLEVFYEVRQVASTITDELIGWCKKLMNFLQGVCNGRLRDLSHKKKETDIFSKKARHAVFFVEAALKSGDDLSILQAKSLMSKNLMDLQSQNVNVQQSIFDLDIKYENDASFLTKNVSKMGFINVNGKSYPQHTGTSDKQDNPLRNLTRENFSQNIADLLNKQPVHVRETYKNYTQEQRKLFLQKLMMQTQQQQQQQQQKQGQHQNRVPPFNSDAGAIRDLYNNNANNMPRQVNQVRPSGTYIPENPLLRQRHLMQQQQQQLQRQLQQHQYQQQQLRQQTYQAARGGSADQPCTPGSTADPLWGTDKVTASQSLTNLAELCRRGPQQGPLVQNGNQMMGQRPPAPPYPGQMIGSKFLPSGKFDIDPLNLKGQDPKTVQVKQEPKDRDYGAACQLAEKPSNNVPSSSGIPHASSSPRLQSPPTNSTTPPSHMPSPSQVDGGTRTSTSPAMPDVGVMDQDRNELMKGLVNPSGHRFSSYHLHPKHDPSDPSEDYCGVCHNGGDLLCCDRCPKVFHLQCHVPSLSSTLSSSEVWTCTMCIPDEDLILNNPVFKEYEITASGKRKAPNGLTDKEIKVCERILLELFCLETTTVFHEPVPKSVPNYYKIIQKPMDFGTIKLKLRRGHFNHYTCIEDFISDVKRIFKNCFKFNVQTSDIYSVGKSVENFFESLIHHFLPCYVDHLNRRTPSPVDFDTNGVDMSRNKKRRSPAPDSSHDTPPGPPLLHYT